MSRAESTCEWQTGSTCDPTTSRGSSESAGGTHISHLTSVHHTGLLLWYPTSATCRDIIVVVTFAVTSTAPDDAADDDALSVRQGKSSVAGALVKANGDGSVTSV